MAWLTVGRLAPVSCARSRSDGSRTPSGSPAETISCSIWPAISSAATGSPSRCPAGAPQDLPDLGAVGLLRPGQPSLHPLGRRSCSCGLPARSRRSTRMCSPPCAECLLATCPNIWMPKPPSRSSMTRRFHGRRTICVVSRRMVRGWVMMWSAIAKPARDQLLARHDLVDQPVLQRLAGVDRLSGQQRVGGALGAEQFLEGVVYPVGGDRADVVVQVEQHGVLRRDGDVAHQ